MADYNLKLSQFHQRVWQDELGLSATIDKYGWIQFGRTDMGELSIFLGEYSPEGMTLKCQIFEDLTDMTLADEALLRISNTVNQYETQN